MDTLKKLLHPENKTVQIINDVKTNVNGKDWIMQRGYFISAGQLRWVTMAPFQK